MFLKQFNVLHVKSLLPDSLVCMQGGLDFKSDSTIEKKKMPVNSTYALHSRIL